MDPTTVNIGGWFLAEIFIIEHLIAAFIGMTLWKNKRGDPSGAVILCAILGILGVIILAIAKPRHYTVHRSAAWRNEAIGSRRGTNSCAK